MSLPAFVLSIILGSLCAGLFHFFFARRAQELAYYWPAGAVGFVLGALLGLLIPWQGLVIGEVHLVEGIVCSSLALFLVRWLRSRD